MITIGKHADIDYYVAKMADERQLNSSVYAEWVTDDDWPDISVLRQARYPHADNRVFEIEGGLVYVTINSKRNVSANVYAATDAECQVAIDSLKGFLKPAPRRSGVLDVTFWFDSPTGPRSYNRQLDAPTWTGIERNYPAKTRDQVGRLMRLEPDGNAGKLILWQGEPGAGKTYALRALAEEWADWCRIHYVLDPERFFGDGSYLVSVVLGNDELPASPNGPNGPVSSLVRAPWRLIVLEDTGELLSKDAKERAGQGLSRLLNLCDGLLGQGLRVMVMITTNEEVGTLHGAVMRPGRCLSHIVFDQFDAESARAWLNERGKDLPTKKKLSLAEMYAILEGEARTVIQSVGFVQ